MNNWKHRISPKKKKIRSVSIQNKINSVGREGGGTQDDLDKTAEN